MDVNYPYELRYAIFSKKKYFRPQKAVPTSVGLLIPFSFDFTYLNLVPKNCEISKISQFITYPIDEDLFYSKLEEWNVEFDK